MFYLYLVINTDHKPLPNDFYQILTKAPWKMPCKFCTLQFLPEAVLWAAPFESWSICVFALSSDCPPHPTWFPQEGHCGLIFLHVVDHTSVSPTSHSGLVILYDSTSNSLCWVNHRGGEVVSVFGPLHLEIIMPVEEELKQMCDVRLTPIPSFTLL